MTSLSRLACNEHGFIFDPARGDSYVANKTGIVIIEALKAGKDAAGTTTALLEKFDVCGEQAEEDVAEFLAQLKTFGLK